MTRSRPTRAALGGAVLLLLLAGCGGGPVLAGAAATVGDTRIATTDLAALVDRALADPQAQQQLGADRESFQRASLSRLITHDLLVAAAAREGVRVLPGQVDARLAELEQQSGGADRLVRRAAENGVPEQDLRPFVSDLVLTDALGDALTADLPVPQARLQAAYQGSAQYDQVHAAHILVRTRAQAESIRRQLAADPGRFAELAKRFSIDTSNNDTGGDLGFAGRGTFVPAFERAIFAAKQGDLLVVQTEFGFHVVRILERRTTPLAEATPQLRRVILQQERTQRVGALLRQVAADLGVRVSPRFGRWDSAAGAVVPVGPGVGGVSSPAPPGPGAGLAPGGRPGAPGGGQPGEPGAPGGGQPGEPGAPGGGQPGDPGTPQGEPPAPPAP